MTTLEKFHARFGAGPAGEQLRTLLESDIVAFADAVAEDRARAARDPSDAASGARCRLRNAITERINGSAQCHDDTRIAELVENLEQVVAAEAVRAALAPSAPSPEQPADTVDVSYYVAGESADAIYDKYSDPDDSVCLREAPEDADDDSCDDEHVYSVRTVITRHDGSAPAHDRATRVVWTVINPGYEKADDAIQYALSGHAIDSKGIAECTADDCGDDLYRIAITAERAGKDGTGT